MSKKLNEILDEANVEHPRVKLSYWNDNAWFKPYYKDGANVWWGLNEKDQCVNYHGDTRDWEKVDKKTKLYLYAEGEDGTTNWELNTTFWTPEEAEDNYIRTNVEIEVEIDDE